MEESEERLKEALELTRKLSLLDKVRLMEELVAEIESSVCELERTKLSSRAEG